MTPDQEYMTIREAADFLRVHPRTIHRWCAMGVLAKHKIAHSSRSLIRVADLRRLIEGQAA